MLADIGQQGHEAGSFDRVLDGALECGAVATALAAEHLALTGDHLLETLNVLVIDERRPRATFLRAESATVLAAATQLLPDHSHLALKGLGILCLNQTIRLLTSGKSGKTCEYDGSPEPSSRAC